MGCVPAGKAVVLGRVTAWEPAGLRHTGTHRGSGRRGRGESGSPSPGRAGTRGTPHSPRGGSRALHACRGHASHSSGPRPTGTRGSGTAPPSRILAGGSPFPPPPSLPWQPPSPSEPPGPVPGSSLSAAGAAEPARSRADPPRPPAANKGAGTGHRRWPLRPLPAAGALRRGTPAAPAGCSPGSPREAAASWDAPPRGAARGRGGRRRSRGAARAGPGREGKGARQGTKEPRAAAGSIPGSGAGEAGAHAASAGLGAGRHAIVLVLTSYLPTRCPLLAPRAGIFSMLG